MDPRIAARRFFRRFAAAQVTIPKNHGNVYELYIYTLVCRAVAASGRTIHFATPTPGTFPFRASPGGVSNSWGYCQFVGLHGTYEIRNGVEVLGHSGMAHESDISVFRVPAGASNAHGVKDELVFAIECKHYVNAAALKAEVRKNLGMVQDWSTGVHASRTGRLSRGCIECGIGFTPLFVTNVPESARPDIHQYLASYELTPRFGVKPGSKRANGLIKELTSGIAVL